MSSTCYLPEEPESLESLIVRARAFPDLFLVRVGRALDRTTEDMSAPFNANFPLAPTMRDWYVIVMDEINSRFPGRLSEVIDGAVVN